MANLNLYSLYSQKQIEFATQGVNSDNWDATFLMAVNRSINMINRLADLETRITRASKKDQSITLDEKYEDVLSDGVSMWMMKMGQRPARGAEAIVKVHEKAFLFGIDQIRQDIMNIAIEADTDDETDFIGLGALG